MNFQHLPKIGKILLLAAALIISGVIVIIFLILSRNYRQNNKPDIQTPSPEQTATKETSPMENFLNNYKTDTEEITSLLKEINPLDIFNRAREQLANQPSEKIESAPANSSSPPSEQVLKTYGNALGAVIKKYKDQITTGSAVFNQAIENADEKTLTDLKALASVYRQINNEIAAIKPPEKAGPIHISLTETYAGLAAAIEKLAASAKDSKIPPESFVEYSRAAMAINQKAYDLMAFFKENGVVFQSNEAGYVFYVP
ncbi:MAG: hypothetical protein A3D52_00220 [Candidatus Taylorbacteria bacterium RIFCSPHIGHO2_02_FULL_44_36]|uniref:Uncharacterized protein n=1 Tax=Candidatus Taylorbacteria bacterium RIFCSPLOWO2_12_FULL_44_15c TaxID=1802333 RepID=A0A1G2P6N6_9BACT|nr:MAG: hypothetical protein A3D52_00220 [Candidatus Taylorbacteria bacterium RIFCSPHIGHO2_02_FULL_44_36]OHA39173.1 MAG: hypothetical protein A3I97_00650 [Candidatus Taylorbacteria bacterium RIFCSPLOWO2_02_FULL_44_35]OHA43379.1 MAG: hypothetical protein A3G03_03375 [Candidatus Taylorbacteria bacterium RIFCSPLOWO2_12_FULL_44_15c]